MKKMFPVFALGALMMFVASCEKETEIENKEEQGTENADTFLVEAVDLGLSVKWASYNVGAKSPEDYGGYYAWGETEEKDSYDSANYYWENEGSNISGTSYDVAHVKWGGSWRMPTLDEIIELGTKCFWEWTTVNGVSGYKVTGSNDNYIFLPASGSRFGTEVYSRGLGGFYWSGSPGEEGSSGAYHLGFGSSVYSYYYDDGCYCGRTVRPVTE